MRSDDEGGGIDRRRVFEGLVATIVAVGAFPSLARAQDATPAAGGVSATFFGADQLSFLAAMADTLIPATDTPGALAAEVHLGVDELMRNWASKARQAAAPGVVAAIQSELDARSAPTGFLAADAAVRTNALAGLDAEAYGPNRNTLGDYRDLKDLMVRLYYNSEIGASVELQYDPIPGEYVGNAKLADLGGRAWAQN